MSILIAIPARYQSSRFPGKPLSPLRGAGGEAKTLIERSWLAAKAVAGNPRVVVATDDQRIADEVTRFGGEPVMTPESCANGTERCAAVIDALGISPEIVVNFQGDALLTPPWFVEALITSMREAPCDVATPVLRCDAETHSNFVEDRRAGRVGGTTAVFDAAYRALYFSKEVIPYLPRPASAFDEIPVFHHVGLYAYTPAALRRYRAFENRTLEVLEGLEQLRFLENGMEIRCVPVEARGRVFWELNNPEDTARIEKVLRETGTR